MRLNMSEFCLSRCPLRRGHVFQTRQTETEFELHNVMKKSVVFLTRRMINTSVCPCCLGPIVNKRAFVLFFTCKSS